MENRIKVYCTNTGAYHDVPAGSSLLEIQELLNIKSEFPIVNCKVNNKTESLSFRLYNPKNIEFVNMADPSGVRTYVRSLCFIFAKAVYELYPGVQMNIEHPIAKGYYCVISRREPLTEEDIRSIKTKMQELITQNLPFEAVEDETKTVVELFRNQGFDDKALLLETSDALYSKYYRLGDYIDYFYGSLVPSSGYVKLFDIQLFKQGILLRVPSRTNPVELEPVVEQSKMFDVYKEELDFLRIAELDNVGDLNRANKEGKISGIIKLWEALQEKKISKIAEQIKHRSKDGVRLVLISGPSSSGKTTFRKRLEVQLMANSIHPQGISLDDYFVNRVDTPRDENGEYDYESLYSLDLKQFNEDLTKLLNGEKVSLPTYNFTTGKREYKGHELQIGKHQVLVVEGIHGLNPELTKQIDDSKKFMIYVSALTSISLDNHNWISTSDNRCLRRLIRDYRYRNYSAVETLSRWPSVRKGEEKWIFPYQENADVMFNSAMIYELAAMRRHAEPILMQVPKNVPEYAEANRFLKFLNYFNYISDRELPPTSLLREFLGGSSFKY
ncbi:uridine kinase [Dysgonomonas sp. PH5-45]|uniref:nucleoside kinase n=1 Tax=unclassified Dysgonomonas TaxID=2630389 RepID=UPI0024740809|nr:MULTISPECIES: nucleoside kinase [unclassified Dysgonomonas]MDH6355705.1 uridine kinase [Dysgonomonas sp. PH5-45]MDH6388602.1 uridine kinase [Dysgonomonas sp. PH5-37]